VFEDLAAFTDNLSRQTAQATVLRSLLFNVVMLLSAAVYFPLMRDIVLPLPHYRRSAPGRDSVDRAEALCRLDYGWKDATSAGGSAIVLSKHQSAWSDRLPGIFPPQRGC
jgi:hypothetical protein